MRFRVAILLAFSPSTILTAQPAHAQSEAGPTAILESRMGIARKIAAITVPDGLLKSAYGALVPQMMEAAIRAQLGNAAYEARKENADFKEGLRRSSIIVSDGISNIISPFEAKLREAYATAYARQFNETGLSEILAFYGTPVGNEFAHRSVALISDPAVIALQREIAPAVTNALPGIMEKVKAATADLAPPAGSKAETK